MAYSGRDMVSTVLAMSLMSFGGAEAVLPAMQTRTLVFFVQGVRGREYSREELGEMQNGHIANLQRLYRERKSPLAGPVGEWGDRRGIVVLDLKAGEAAREFEGDPFVKEGLLKLETHEWTIPRDIFAWPTGDEFVMEQGWIAVAMKGKAWSGETTEQLGRLQAGHVELNLEMMREGVAGAVGPLGEGSGDWRGVYLFPARPRAEIDGWFSRDPLVQAGHLEILVKPLYMGRGLFRRLAR